MRVHHPHGKDRVASSAARPPVNRRRGAVAATIAALIAASLPVIAVVAPLAVETVAIADTNHPRWKDFVTWLMDKKRTPQEELILGYILSGGPGFTWLNVYSHSMQEQTEALFRRWLQGHGNPRQIPNLSDRPIGNSRG
jgi:hypothetical protein